MHSALRSFIGAGRFGPFLRFYFWLRNARQRSAVADSSTRLTSPNVEEAQVPLTLAPARTVAELGSLS
eukprot:2597018-Karenia_brevis.AAC.1